MGEIGLVKRFKSYTKLIIAFKHSDGMDSVQWKLGQTQILDTFHGAEGYPQHARMIIVNTSAVPTYMTFEI